MACRESVRKGPFLISRDPDDLYVDAAALNVHGFYAGLERISTLIAERLDGSLPSGPIPASWAAWCGAQPAHFIELHRHGFAGLLLRHLLYRDLYLSGKG